MYSLKKIIGLHQVLTMNMLYLYGTNENITSKYESIKHRNTMNKRKMINLMLQAKTEKDSI